MTEQQAEMTSERSLGGVDRQFEQLVRGRRLARLERLRRWPSFRGAAALGVMLGVIGFAGSLIDRWWPSMQPPPHPVSFTAVGTLVGGAIGIATTVALCLIGATLVRGVGWIAHRLGTRGA